MRVQEHYIAFGEFIRSFLAYLSTSSQRERMGLARILIGNLIEDIRTKSPEKDVEPFLKFLDVLNQEIEIDSEHERNDMTPFRLVLLDQMSHQVEMKKPVTWNNLVGSVGHALGTYILENAVKLKREGKIDVSEGTRICTDCVSRNAEEAFVVTEGSQQRIIPPPLNKAEISDDQKNQTS